MALGTRLLDASGQVLARIGQKLGVSGTSEGVLHAALYPATLSTSDGAYSVGGVSGTIAAGAAANSEVFTFRWTNAASTCQVQRVTFSAQCAGTAFAAGLCSFSMKVARSWTVDGAGGTALTPSRRRASMPSSVLTRTAIASTGAMAAGTKTFDSANFAAIAASAGTSTTQQIVNPGTVLWARPETDGYPLLLVANEGFSVLATVPITGTWTCAVSVDWTETLLANF
jgi:hypothetical protein